MSTNLSVELGKLHLKNPVMVAAGPWARNAASIRRCIEAGAAAVITETISLEAKENLSPRFYIGRGGQLFNTKLYSDLQLEQWENELERLDRGDCKLIVSIWGSSASELSYLASRAERMGADAVEISISAPIGSGNQTLSFHPPFLHEFAQAVVKTVSIPVIVKLSYEAGCSPEFAASIHRAGVEIVSAIDALRGLSGVDIEHTRAWMPAYGGYSGADIRPVALAAVAALRQHTPFHICGCGGIFDYRDALEHIMLGAGAVQLASAIQLRGYGVITDLLNGLTAWLDSHEYSSLDAVRGAALPSLKPFEEIRPRPMTVVPREDCTDIDCDICLSGCLYDAVFRDASGRIAIHADRCDGCGLCSARCPHRRLSLGWQ